MLQLEIDKLDECPCCTTKFCGFSTSNSRFHVMVHMECWISPPRQFCQTGGSSHSAVVLQKHGTIETVVLKNLNRTHQAVGALKNLEKSKMRMTHTHSTVSGWKPPAVLSLLSQGEFVGFSCCGAMCPAQGGPKSEVTWNELCFETSTKEPSWCRDPLNTSSSTASNEKACLKEKWSFSDQNTIII